MLNFLRKFLLFAKRLMPGYSSLITPCRLKIVDVQEHKQVLQSLWSEHTSHIVFEGDPFPVIFSLNMQTRTIRGLQLKSIIAAFPGPCRWTHSWTKALSQSNKSVVQRQPR